MKAEPYRAATYSSQVDTVLSQPTRIGQGGQIEGDFGYVFVCLARLRASLYNFLANEIQKAIGEDGAATLLRAAIVDQAKYRFELIRLHLERAGLPADVEHLIKWYDFPSNLPAGPKDLPQAMAKGVQEVSRVATLPHWEEQEVFHCEIHDTMTRVCPDVERLDILYCEETHRAAARVINRDIEVWYPALLTRGQGKCAWRYAMPKQSALKARELAELYRTQAKKDDRAKDLLEFGTRAPYKANATPSMAYEFDAEKTLLLYHFILDSLVRLKGFNSAYGIAKDALHRWGDWRGREMREDHQRRGWSLDVHNFITYHDDPAAGDAWVAENVVLTPEEHVRIVKKSFFANKLNEFGTGKLGVLFEEEALQTQVSAYSSSMEVNIPRLIERGDDVSEFHFKLRKG
jgi:hypothetical protein